MCYYSIGFLSRFYHIILSQKYAYSSGKKTSLELIESQNETIDKFE